MTQESLSLINTFHGIPIKAHSKFSNPLMTVSNLGFPFLARYRVVSEVSLGAPVL